MVHCSRGCLETALWKLFIYTTFIWKVQSVYQILVEDCFIKVFTLPLNRTCKLYDKLCNCLKFQRHQMFSKFQSQISTYLPCNPSVIVKTSVLCVCDWPLLVSIHNVEVAMANKMGCGNSWSTGARIAPGIKKIIQSIATFLCSPSFSFSFSLPFCLE